MKVLLIGGHITPALALLDEALLTNPSEQFVVAGRLHTRPSDQQASFEAASVQARGVRFVPFEAPKMTAGWTHQPSFWLALVGSLVRALLLILAIRPTVIVSFGGYLAVPITLAGWLMRVRIVTHEQTSHPGTATQLIARWATRVAVSDWTNTKQLPSHKTVLTGLPLRPQLFNKSPRPEWLPKSTLPLLYISGGSQGSHAINQLIGLVLPQLLQKWQVVHQCGPSTNQFPHQENLAKVAATLSVSQQKAYVLRESLSETELAYIYQAAGAMVSRAGANTVAEIAAFNLPAILIPLPLAKFNEQQINAEWLALHQKSVVTLAQRPDMQLEFLAHLDRLPKRTQTRIKASEATRANHRLWRLIQDVQNT